MQITGIYAFDITKRTNIYRPLKRMTPPYYVNQLLDNANRNKSASLILSVLCKGTSYEKNESFKQTMSGLMMEGRLNPCKINAIIRSGSDKYGPSTSDYAGQIARMICFSITGRSFPEYFYGLKEQVMLDQFNFLNAWAWLVKDWVSRENKLLSIPRTASNLYFNMTFLEQTDFGGVHRSGWQFVVNHMLQYHRTQSEDTILDFYMDKTFGWYSEFYKQVGRIPFTKNWVGFMHHTFAEEYSENNAKAVIRSDAFRQSLSTCKGIFVLSQDLRAKVVAEIQKVIAENNMLCKVPFVNVLAHPTEMPAQETFFDMQKFLANPEKKVIQV